jgi:hypothetical protein
MLQRREDSTFTHPSQRYRLPHGGDQPVLALICSTLMPIRRRAPRTACAESTGRKRRALALARLVGGLSLTMTRALGVAG